MHGHTHILNQANYKFYVYFIHTYLRNTQTKHTCTKKHTQTNKTQTVKNEEGMRSIYRGCGAYIGDAEQNRAFLEQH